MDRSTALRIFGVSEVASEDQLQAAYWRLRAHLEQRLEDSYSNAEAAACRAELHELDVALELAVGSKSIADRLRPTFGSPRGRSLDVPLPAVLAAGMLILLLGVLAIRVGFVTLPAGSLLASWIGAGGDSEASTQGEGGGDADAEGPPARISVTGNLEGATLAVVDLETGEVALEGAANGAPYELPPGRYGLTVEHEKCFDAWSEELELAAGDQRDMLARNCTDQGWLVVRSNVADDRLEIDGQPLGSTSTDPHPLEPGEHEIRVAKSGYGVWRGSISVPAAQTVTLRADLAPDSEQQASGSQQQQQQQAAAPRPPPPQQPQQQAAAAPRPQQRPPGGSPGGEREPSAEELRANHRWHQTARQYLISRYDHNRSGDFDSAEEIQSIPCDDWLGLEQAFDGSRLQLSMTRFYGFDGTKWVEGAFGIRGDMRAAAYERLRECGLQ